MKARHAALSAVASAAMILAPLSESPVAQATSSPNVVGQKLSEARAALGEAGYTAVVSTTMGAQLDWADCIVVRQQDRTVQPPSNSQYNGGVSVKQTLLSLDCAPSSKPSA